MTYANSYPQPVAYPQQPTYQQPTDSTPVSMYTYTAVPQPYNKTKGSGSRTLFSVLASVLVVVGLLVTLLGAVLPFLKRGRSLNLVHANLGAGLSVMLAALLAVALIIIAVVAKTNVTVSRIFALLGGLSGVFLIVFTLANLFGAEANHIIDIGGSRGVGGVLLVIGGILAVISAVLAMLASLSNSLPAKTSAATPTIPAGVPAAAPAQSAVPTQQV